MALIGQALLPDIGTLAYNGVTFNSLFKSKVTGRAVRDEANRTVKYVEWTIDVEGFVTLDVGKLTIDDQMTTIKFLLNQQAGVLNYSGRGLGAVNVNLVGGLLQDVAWGPKPEVLSFQPLGGSRSAMVHWTVTTCLPLFNQQVSSPVLTTGNAAASLPPVLQFTEETSISYDEECYSSISIKGTLEIPLTRTGVNNRQVVGTVDSFRQVFMEQILRNFDLNKFRVVRRNFPESRDKRTLEWEFLAEELPPMGLPEFATSARGRFSVRPFKPAASIVHWVCSLTGTYVIRSDTTRLAAYWAFMALLKFRMEQSEFGFIPDTVKKQVAEQDPDNPKEVPPPEPPGLFGSGLDQFKFIGNAYEYYKNKFLEQIKGSKKKQKTRRCIPMHFGFDEGLYLDSKTITFECSWWLFTAFSHLLIATGVWKQEVSSDKARSRWATSVRNIMGWRGPLENLQTAREDVIVDFGGP